MKQRLADEPTERLRTAIGQGNVQHVAAPGKLIGVLEPNGRASEPQLTDALFLARNEGREGHIP